MGKYCTAWVTPYIQTVGYDYHDVPVDQVQDYIKKMRSKGKVANISSRASNETYSVRVMGNKLKEPIIERKWNHSCGCTLEPCKCDYSCFYCKRTKLVDCSYSPFNGHEYMTLHGGENIRKKFVCLDCEHIWKSYAYASMRHNPELLEEMGDRYVELAGFERGYEDTHRSIIDGSKDSRCSKCAKKGIEVGPTFRHCKNKKEWKKLKEKVKNKEIDLFVDFFYCPVDSERIKRKNYKPKKDKFIKEYSDYWEYQLPFKK